jgi:cellulose synthase/poly-beta-1,6-N-acetylglucosamine synthase-like glycosyltransferase
MEADSPVPGRPVVSVIIPARNEEASLASCLESLLMQQADFLPGSLEIIVVDDGSTDRTRAIAESVPNVFVISAPEPTLGWTGKNNALVAGVEVARGDWLLFTDADTRHLPGSLARALQEATQHQAAMLSYSPEQKVEGVLQKAVMPVIFAELAATYQPSRVSDPSSSAAAANGQYLLIKRAVYRAIGGHAAVSDTLLEDVALARLVKQSGYKIRFRYAADAVQTRMYRSFGQLVEGWTKNLAVLFPGSTGLAALRMAEFVLLIGSVTTVAVSRPRSAMQLASAAVFAVTAALFWRRIRRANFSPEANLLAVTGLPIFSYLLLRSRLSYARGTVTWKGRTYGVFPSLPESAAPIASKLPGAL